MHGEAKLKEADSKDTQRALVKEQRDTEKGRAERVCGTLCSSTAVSPAFIRAHKDTHPSARDTA